MDYVHFNPVKHGYVSMVARWPYSTFHRWVRQVLIQAIGVARVRWMLLPTSMADDVVTNVIRRNTPGGFRPTRAHNGVSGGPRVIAHLVHGTWPAGGFLAHTYPRFFKPQPTWFDAGSDFQRAIEEGVPGIEWRAFKWSGENSEIERRKASRLFADALQRELDAAPEACHVVIAHSHGGNVALWALGQLDETKRDKVAG